ncbi:AMP-binding protein [Streptomyces lunaelactis]|uniref:AMP-binding protein n=1 Tax=Streptomyces lunaelactis TaxID=1535768 RepID=UPI0015850B24|nr:class I adenylate-forming enzyme family protein [Streptomyces lunaelactis]NUK57072.1 acyl--CoA ligase [Streptomyces lunaelactis]
MGFQELTPKELLGAGHAAPEINDTAWHVRWDAPDAPDASEVLAALPPEVEFHTSGSTGPSRCWQRTREYAWSEAGMLAGFVSAGVHGPPGAVVAFAPPLHVYGALATYLMPARLGVPVWYRKSYVGAMPEVGHGHTVVVATPWIFSLLLRNIDWVRSLGHLTVLYSSAMLPGDAHTLLEQAGSGRVTLVELLGSTETGGIATRRWSGGEPPAWTLFPDVSYGTESPSAGTAQDTESAAELVIRSPRLGHQPGQPRPADWRTGDLVEPVDARTFRLVGRVGRLVKVNGRRINLDETEHVLRTAIDCEDLALVAVGDPMTGEQIDLHVVSTPGTDLSEVPALLGVRPRKVHKVPRINRSKIGKLLHHQKTPVTEPVTQPRRES